jgi:hypothetical protein
MTALTPIFCVVLKDGEHWQVEAEWPDGTLRKSINLRPALRLSIGYRRSPRRGRPNEWG